MHVTNISSTDSVRFSVCFVTVKRAFPGLPNKLLTYENYVYIRQLNEPCDGVQLTTMRTLQEGVTFNQISTPRMTDKFVKEKIKKKSLLGGQGKARRTVCTSKLLW